MERWQKKYITSHIHKLVELTLCNETLLAQLSSDGFLSKEDRDTILSEPKQHAQTRILYDILQTRTHAFGGIARALKENNQSGAYRIFQQGYIQCLPGELNCSFLGETMPIGEHLEEATARDLIQKHVHLFERKSDNNEDSNEDGKQDINEDTKEIIVIKQTESPNKHRYIPRQLFKRYIVNKEVFQVESNDIFVFKGIQHYQVLVDLVDPYIFALSSTQLGKRDSRFIRLEDDEEHWRVIRDNADAPVHLIKYEDETKTCVLELTAGRSSIINRYVTKEKHTAEISEEAFIDQVHNDSTSGVCICDSPGMGKTLLFANLVHRIAQRYPGRLVAFITLADFVKNVTPFDALQKIDKHVVENYLVQYLATSELAQDILKSILKTREIQMELLFDGFDEVPPLRIRFTSELLRQVARNFPNSRVYVSSRPHLRKELEESLGVLSYDILPFTDANQMDFLINFWNQDKEVFDKEKLQQFANRCLEATKTCLKKNEENITGIPLQCHLLGQVYSEKAKVYATSNVLLEEVGQFESSLPDLFVTFVEQRRNSLKQLTKASMSDINNFHIGTAFRTLFPEFDIQPFLIKFEDVPQSVLELSLSMGILERRGTTTGKDSVGFVHRTFAEYFVSEFVAGMLRDSTLTRCWPLLVKILTTKETITEEDEVEDQIFVNSFIVYFLDFFVDHYRPLSSVRSTVKHFQLSVSPSQLNAIFLGCARHNHIGLLKFVHDILRVTENNVLEQYKKEILSSDNPNRTLHLLNVASVFSSLSFIEEVFLLFQQCFGYDLKIVVKMHTDQESLLPLHFALERVDEQMVQFFAKITPLKGHQLLHSCLMGSQYESVKIIERKAKICEWMIGLDNDLLTEANCTLFDGTEVHVELIKVLVKAGANPLAAKSLKTIVHCAACYMYNNHFHELCSFLILEQKMHELFKAKISEWKDPLPTILRQQKHSLQKTLKLILESRSVDDKLEDANNGRMDNLFLLAVKERHDKEIINLLLNSGADLNTVDGDGKNSLHLAAESKDVRMVRYLLDKEVDCCQSDIKQNTFLHSLANEEITADQYHDIIILLSKKEKTGVFRIANKDEQLPLHLAVHYLEVKDESLELLMSNGVDFNAVDRENSSLLMYAVIGNRSVRFLKILISMRVNIFTKNIKGETFAHIISKYYSVQEYHELTAFLISEKLGDALMMPDNFERTPLHWAVLHKELLPETLELINRNLVIEKNLNINITTQWMHSILFCAAEGQRSIDFLKLLINMGIDVMIQDNEGDTFVHLIACYYSTEEYYHIMEFLIEKGYDKVYRIANNQGITSLHWAVHYLDHHQETWDIIETKRLLSDDINDAVPILVFTVHGVDSNRKISRDKPVTLVKWNERDTNPQTHRRIERKWKSRVPKSTRSIQHLKALIDMGADTLAQDKDGNTFAHYIPHWYTPDEFHHTIDYTLSKDKHRVFTVANKDRETPFHIAGRYLELLDETLYLIKAILLETNGESIFLLAATGKWKCRLLKMLIECDADLYHQNADGNTFAHLIPQYFSGEDYHNILMLLIQKSHQNLFTIPNHKGQTPLHIAFLEMELLDVTLELINTSLFRTNIVDINRATTKGSSVLILAVMKSWRVELLEILIGYGVDLHLQNEDGNAFIHLLPLYYSAEQYHQIIKMLIRKGHRKILAVINRNGETPVHIAVLELELLEATLGLLDAEVFSTNIVDIKSATTAGNSILMYAVIGKRSIRILLSLIKIGADPYLQNNCCNTFAHFIPAYYTTEEDYHQVVSSLIRINYGKTFSLLNEDQRTPLHIAALKINIPEATLELINSELFKTKIVDINMTDNVGNSILMYAAFRSARVRILQILIDNGANLSIKNKSGDTFAHFIAKYYTREIYPKIVKLIIERGQANVFQIKNNEGKTPIHVAVYFQDLLPETLDLLANSCMSSTEEEAGQKQVAHALNAVDNFGNSVLHWAVRGKRSIRLVQHMIALGANYLSTNDHNSNLAHVAANMGSFEHLQYFLDMGCDVDGLDNDGNNVLQCAENTSKNFLDIQTLLLEKVTGQKRRYKKFRPVHCICVCQ